MEKEGIKEKYLRWFSDLGKGDVVQVGGKSANLGEMLNSGLPVPQGFSTTADAYKYFLEKTELDKKIYEMLNKLDVEKTKELEEASKIIKKMVIDAEMPEDMRAEILEAYDTLSFKKEDLQGASEIAKQIIARGHEPVFVAVRSSATAEDSEKASFAGQQETFLNVKGNEELILAIKKCFASLFSPRSIYYRVKKGFTHEEVLIAVVVQVMVNSDKSGVLFSKDPVELTDNIVVEAVYGLGEGIVSGRIKPDHYVVSRDLEIIKKEVAEKKTALVRDSSGKTIEVSLTPERAKSQVLTTSEIKQLAQYALKLEKHYNLAQDSEFAIDSGKIYMVQTRPVTTLKEKAKTKVGEITGKELLSGQPASPGVGSGVVRIVEDISELNKVGEGDILVTKMTNPDMVVTMQKAAGIVTDEGGATCFSGDTKILTNLGFMTIETAHDLIKENKNLRVLSYDHKNKKPVWKGTINSFKRKSNAIRISTSQTGKIEHNTLDMTPDHKVYTYEGRDLIKKQINDVISCNEGVCLIDSLPQLSPETNMQKLAYLIGALITDGNIKIDLMKSTGNPRRGRITLTQKETDSKIAFIQEVNDCLLDVFGQGFSSSRVKETSGYIRNAPVQGIATDFVLNSLKPAMALNNIQSNLDLWTMGLNESSCLSYLAGLIDGDGCFANNRINLYLSEEKTLQSVMLACLKLGIFPQVTKNRDIFNVQILERLQDILSFTKRVKGDVSYKQNGTKLFFAKQILGDVIDSINWKGQTKLYVKNNLLIDSRKILERILPMADAGLKGKLLEMLKSNIRMHRASKICDISEIDVFNIEVDADEEMEKNYVVFTKNYTPLVVSNCHAAIVSREMGIPAVVGTGNATEILKDGMEVTVDGFKGKIHEGKSAEVEVEIKPIVPTQTKVKVIVDLPTFAERSAKTEAKCVGLMRIEGIIAESGYHPMGFLQEKKMDEYENIIYKGISGIAEHFEEVWIRTSDVRSDEYHNLKGAPEEIELNPMLGMHGVRAGIKYKEIMQAELKAASRAASEGKKIGIMMPQIISVEEVEAVQDMMKELGINNLILGIMVETPAACMIIEELCQSGIKFISFGTNDLTQFTLAIDRGNEEVQFIYDETNPAVLKQIAHVIKICKKYDVETSICGQAGSKKEMAEFLVKHGIDSISVNADKALEISSYIKEMEDKGLRGSETEQDLICQVITPETTGKMPVQKPVETQTREKAKPELEQAVVAVQHALGAELAKPTQPTQSEVSLDEQAVKRLVDELNANDDDNPNQQRVQQEIKEEVNEAEKIVQDSREDHGESAPQLIEEVKQEDNQEKQEHDENSEIELPGKKKNPFYDIFGQF